MPPTLGNGKICYVEVPATDVQTSANFYQQVFGWNVRTCGDGRLAFDDDVGQVSGAWVVGRPPMSEVGLLAPLREPQSRQVSRTQDAGTEAFAKPNLRHTCRCTS